VGAAGQGSNAQSLPEVQKPLLGSPAANHRQDRQETKSQRSLSIPVPSRAHTVPDGPASPPSVALLYCPLRGPLNVAALAKDGLTATEEARRIDFIKFLLERGYPDKNIAVETVIIKQLGESGRNKLRCDVIVYSESVARLQNLNIKDRLPKALIVAELKRDSKKSATAWEHQLEPAMRLLPGLRVMGAYWDDINRVLFTKHVIDDELRISKDSLSNLPKFGSTYKHKLLSHSDIQPSANLVGVLFNIANVMRSHGINDEHVRYKETVKLLLARYCDEREGSRAPTRPLALQLYPGTDPDFTTRVADIYRTAAKRYSLAKTLFDGGKTTELKERTLKEIVRQIQGINFTAASNETMQQVFMSFVPSVFKKSLDQYFTPIQLVKAMVGMVRIGPNDKIADPGMGTADFLTAAAELRLASGDDDILGRIYGIDSDQKAFDLAVVNMILNKDGSSNLFCEDSIENHKRFANEMGVVLCNPPFGENSIESRAPVLEDYDLGHQWEQDVSGGWKKTDQILNRQQLGLLFIEKCFKLLDDDGRLAIILPEGYLCTPMYGYVRQWLIEHLRIIALIELPRRIFVKSNADLRSNVLIAQKLSNGKLRRAIADDYPIYADMVRKVGFKMGKGYPALYVRDKETGIEIRNQNNERITDTDFNRISAAFDQFTAATSWDRARGKSHAPQGWAGAKISDVTGHHSLDLKQRRLMPKALQNIRDIKARKHAVLSDIADVLQTKIDVLSGGLAKLWRPVAGLDIRAVEGIVTPSHPTRAWRIADEKDRKVFLLQDQDIVVGLVRPERRNVGLLLSSEPDIVGIPDGIAVIRVKPECKDDYPQEWLFATLRSEHCRLQFWTAAGGTSYGKLTEANIEQVFVPLPSPAEITEIAGRVRKWAKTVRDSFQEWVALGSDADRKPIINSSGFGLIATDDWDPDADDTAED